MSRSALVFPSHVSSGASACVWWMIQRMHAVWITYEVHVVQFPRETTKVFPIPFTPPPIFSLSHAKLLVASKGRMCAAWHNDTVEVTPFLSLTSLVLRCWDEAAAVMVLFPHPFVVRLLCPSSPGLSHKALQQTWLIVYVLTASVFPIPTETCNHCMLFYNLLRNPYALLLLTYFFSLLRKWNKFVS